MPNPKLMILVSFYLNKKLSRDINNNEISLMILLNLRITGLVLRL